eukprot:TRINITY_DN3966_c0_g4_i2.p1 TRINITY_DN3966_c0_g4~~TRINITY_DN3966_c0_g4_i2.p1  ORF type:complete len:162 (-),score=33.65 TRINITY_DN3966_c0_g4_i2:304-789(-)
MVSVVDCASAAAHCNFYFSNYKDVLPSYNVCTTKPNATFTTAIKTREKVENVAKILGAVNSGPTVTYLDGSVFQPLSNLNSALTPTQFKSYNADGKAKIGRETFQPKASKSNLLGKCIKVPITQWQVLDKVGGNVIENVDATKYASDTACIVFEFDSTPCP